MVESTNPENNAQDKEALEKNLIDQERFLPIANINRIMKQALPSDTKISKEARECVQECVSEFIAFVTCESCEITKVQKRKTINGEDIIKAMRELNFTEYIDTLELYNKKYKDCLKQDGANPGDETENK